MFSLHSRLSLAALRDRDYALRERDAARADADALWRELQEMRRAFDAQRAVSQRLRGERDAAKRSRSPVVDLTCDSSPESPKRSRLSLF